MKHILTTLLLCIVSYLGKAQSSSLDTFTNFKMNLVSVDSDLYLETDQKQGFLKYKIHNEERVDSITNGRVSLTDTGIDFKGKLLFFKSEGGKKLYHVAMLKDGGMRIRHIPLWLSIIPPLMAIIIALIFKEVVVALFTAVWAGAFIAGGLRIESAYYFLESFLGVIKDYVIGALNDTGHLSVLVFTILIGGMVAIISKNGGMAGVVNSLSKYAKTPRSSQFITYLLGIAIFFDDYANALIVGNTMRSVTDRFKVSREKLAYIVDSTAAPISAIAFITTWIGAELGYIDNGLKLIGLNESFTPYGVFLSSLKYSYYTFYTLIFMFFIIYLKKDFGPMFRSEFRARSTGQVSPARTKSEDEPNMEDLNPIPGAKLNWLNAFVPVMVVILATIYGLVDTGLSSLYADLPVGAAKFSWGSIWGSLDMIMDEGSTGFFKKLGLVIGASDSYSALLSSSLLGLAVAIAMTVSQKIMGLFDSMHWMAMGFKTMLPALIILTLAWALARTTEELQTAVFISQALSGNVNPVLIPTLVFFLAAAISFSTGSSWSTMAILYPIAIPTTYAVCMAANLDMDQTMELLYSVIATVLSASVLGDHCSPISDTTILSSLASDCNHIDHVRTQMPYALTVGAVAVSTKLISSLLGGGATISWLLFFCGVLVLYLIVSKVGKKVDVQIQQSTMN